MDIILYMLNIIQYLYQMNRWLILFICRYIPLRQWAHDDSHSPKYQKFKVDRLPKIVYYEKWDYREYIPYLEWRYGKRLNLSHAAKNATSLMTVPARAAMRPSPTYIRTTVPKARFSARYAPQHFHRKKTGSQNLYTPVSLLLPCPRA